VLMLSLLAVGGEHALISPAIIAVAWLPECRNVC